MAYFRNFEPYDLEAVLSMELREIDKKEGWAALGLDPQAARLASLNATTDGLWVIVERDEIVGVFGIAPLGNRQGCPWLVGTDQLTKLGTRFLRGCKMWMSMVTPYYDLLTNYVAAENTDTIRWLRWLGFTIIPERVTLHDPEVEFVQFYLAGKEK